MSRETGKKKTITIRGIDEDLYERLTVLARETGKTIGELINEGMRVLLSITSPLVKTTQKAIEGVTSVGKAVAEGVETGLGRIREISNIDELTVNKEDLEAIDQLVVFKNIKKLKFEDNVTYELIEAKVKGIILCDEIIIPKTIPKLKLLSKCKLIKRIIVK